MKLLPIVLALAAPLLARAEPAVYRLDPEHSFVYFEVLHFGTSTLRGRLGPPEGFVELDRVAGRGGGGGGGGGARPPAYWMTSSLILSR
jgi:polyisoprenoid-binding protein YceI